MELSPETVDTVLRIRQLDRNGWPKLRHHPRRTLLDAQFGHSCLVAEDFGFELPDLRPVLPAICGEACFAARLRKKRPRVPLPLGSDLGQQQSPLPSHFHHQTVTADL